jgi:hypothetical protein
MRFEDEPVGRAATRQITRYAKSDLRERAHVPKGEFDRLLEDVDRDLDQGDGRHRRPGE